MRDVVQADKAEGGFLGLFDRQVQRLGDGDDAVGALAVDDGQAGVFAFDLVLFPAGVAFLHAAGVGRHEPGAVRVVAQQVALHQVVADDAGVVVGDARGRKDVIGETAQGIVLDNGHKALLGGW